MENKISIKVTDFDIVKKNLITLRDLLIKVKDTVINNGNHIKFKG